MPEAAERIATIIWNDRIKREFICCMLQEKGELRPAYLYSQVCWHVTRVIESALSFAKEDEDTDIHEILASLKNYGRQEHDKNIWSKSEDFNLEAVWIELNLKD